MVRVLKTQSVQSIGYILLVNRNCAKSKIPFPFYCRFLPIRQSKRAPALLSERQGTGAASPHLGVRILQTDDQRPLTRAEILLLDGQDDLVQLLVKVPPHQEGCDVVTVDAQDDVALCVQDASAVPVQDQDQEEQLTFRRIQRRVQRPGHPGCQNCIGAIAGPADQICLFHLCSPFPPDRQRLVHSKAA